MNVFDVMRKRGNRLADSSEAFGLHHRLVVGSIFDSQRGIDVHPDAHGRRGRVGGAR